MKEIFKAVSTNGRWGMAIVGPNEVSRLPAEGGIRHIGKIAGIETYVFEPGPTQTWVAGFEKEVVVHGGATLVLEMGLQSGASASIVLLGPEAVVQTYGYRTRSSSVLAFINGVERSIPETVLAAMGLAKTTGEIIEVAPPPKLEGALAQAFKRL